MFSRIYSVTIVGIKAEVVTVEVDASTGMPSFEMTGYLATEVKEARERVKAAIKNAGVELRPQRVVVNMSPANVRKAGTGFDLPMAIGLMVAHKVLSEELLGGVMLMGELGLDGTVRGVTGVLPGVIAAKEAGFKRCIVPVDNLREAACVKGIDVYGAGCLGELIDYFKGEGQLIKPSQEGMDSMSQNEKVLDYADVYGQTVAKRATLIAVSGMHNIMYVGAPGSGKTMMAMRIPSIMPDLTSKEALELAKIYSVAGMLAKEEPLQRRRPFRNPHHNVTMAAFIGGGNVPRPGEITLANSGVLFLDELTEYSVQIMESLRQPLEDRKIRISRLSGWYEYPADFMLVAAINPCMCGYYPDRNRCNCAEADIRRFIGRISRPLWDRFDMNVHVQPLDFRNLTGEGKEGCDGYTSGYMKEQVMKTRIIQDERFKGENITFNSQMDSGLVRKFCRLGRKETELMEKAYERLGMTARGYHKILKIARTIADIDGKEEISVRHLSEAISYRSYANG